MSNNKVSQLPPTLGIKDPETRQFLDALTNAWEMRSGNTKKDSPERFLTAGELIDGLSGAGGVSTGGQFGVGPTPGSVPGSVAAAIGNLESNIRQGILYQLLTTELDLISLRPINDRIDQAFGSIQSLDTGIRQTNKSLTTSTESMTLQINSAVSRIGTAEGAILSEQITRANADSAITSSLDVAISRIGTAESAIVTEENTRTTKDNALASAINTVWAAIGGNQAVIQDGQLAAVSPSAVAATKWSQVQAAAIDPWTGQPQSAIVRQELNAYSSQVDGKLNAIYSVRAQVSRNGQTVVGGFGLAAVGGAAGGIGPEISFGVTADKFFIAPPVSSSDAADAYLIANTTPTSFPFIALSTPQTVNGVTYQPGVYIRNVNIANAAIDTAKILDASITNAKIQNLAVDTLKIAGGSVTTMTYAEAGGGAVSAGGVVYNVCQTSVSMPSGASGVVINAFVLMAGSPNEATANIVILKNGSVALRNVGVSLTEGYYNSYAITAFDPSPNEGLNIYQMALINPTSGPGSNSSFVYASPSMTLTGGKR